MLDSDLTNLIRTASTPHEIRRAAEKLQAVDSLEAVEPLARFNRRGPGWLLILFSFAVNLLIAAVQWFIALAVITSLLWVTWNILHFAVQTFFPHWELEWWIGLALLTTLWLWKDQRLLALLKDERFSLDKQAFTPLGVVGLWPLQVLARALRLTFGLVALVWRLSPVLMALAALLELQAIVQRNELPSFNSDAVRLGFFVAALYLLLGLWVNADLPPARSESRNAIWLGRFVAAAGAAGLGYVVWQQNPYSDQMAVFAAGVGLVAFWLIAALLRRAARMVGALWKIRLKTLAFSERQVRFLKFNLFFLTVGGAGVIVLEVAQHWPDIHLLLPVLWVGVLTDWTLYNLSASPQAVPYAAGGWAAAGVLGLAFLFGSGLALSLAKPMAWPYFTTYKTVEALLARARARRAVRRAICHHKQRNRTLVAGRGEQAVCHHNHAMRFERRIVKLSYGRVWLYWSCRVCHSDAHGYTGVKTIRGVFDQAMTEAVAQDGPVVRVNLLQWIKAPPAPLDLKEVHVDGVDDQRALEEFVAAYNNYRPPIKDLPCLENIRLTIAPSVTLDDNVERIMRRTFRV